MRRFVDLVYSQETASGEAVSKVETHTPKIEVPETVKAGEPFTVKVSVGPHPNTPEHSIRRLEIYFYEEGRAFNPIHVATLEFEPGLADPEVTLKLRVKKAGTLYAIAYCNLHGLWEGRKEVKVEG
ncbi:MAG: class II SORL domain-containing protein [Desulfurococcales archaeon]|nr:class II SORL domain-containing protein [Desulfurococcales archaeon]